MTKICWLKEVSYHNPSAVLNACVKCDGYDEKRKCYEPKQETIRDILGEEYDPGMLVPMKSVNPLKFSEVW